MENLFIHATSSTPEIEFHFDRHVLTIKGESYPENAQAFYGALLTQVNNYLSETADTDITLNIALAYFNSSSTKALYTMLEAFNQSAKSGNRVTLKWYHEAEDETLFEFGQGIEEDFAALQFVDVPINS